MLIGNVSMTEAGVFAEPVTQVGLTAPGQGSKDALNARIDAAELVSGNRLDGDWCQQTSHPSIGFSVRMASHSELVSIDQIHCRGLLVQKLSRTMHGA